MRKPIIYKTGKSSAGNVYPIYAQSVKMDYESILRSRISHLKIDEDENVIMEDPYTPDKKVAFEYAWRYDPMVRLAINKKVDFIVGERTLTVLDTKKEFTGNVEAAVDAFNNIIGNNVYQEMKTWIDNLNAELQFHETLKAAVINMKIYGRSAIHVEKYENLEPADLKVLNSQKLGEVVVKNDSWNLHCVTYNDFPDDDNVLYADELIYFTNLNYNVTPNTLGYGYSELEPILSVSECNRQIDMVDLPEINAKLWGAYGIIKFLETKDPSAMQKLLRDFKPGTWMATDANIEVDIKELKNSLKELVEERKENDLRIIRAIRLPSFLAGHESISNRATVRSILEAWKMDTINPERTAIKDMIEPQWLNTLVAHYLGQKNIIAKQVKIKQEFQDIVFETVKDLSDSYLPLFEQGLITGYQLLRLLGLDYLADEAKALENKMFEQREQLKTDLSIRMDQLLGENSPKGDMEKSITSRLMKDQIVNDIDTRIGNNINTAMSEFIRNSILKKIAKTKVENGLFENDTSTL